MSTTLQSRSEPPTLYYAWRRSRPSGLLSSQYLVFFLAVIYFLALWAWEPKIASGRNIANVLTNMLPLLAVAVGQTVVLIAGGIDLSVTSIIAMSSIAGAWVMTGDRGLLAGHALAVPAGVLTMLALGATIGLLNGLAISRLRMPPFIVTLTTMMFFSGLALRLTRSQNIRHLPPAFNFLGYGSWLHVPCALILSGVLALLVHLLLSRTVWGHRVHAVGHNRRTAEISGVPVPRVVTSAYLVSGLCAAVGAILYTARLETGSPTQGRQILLDVIGAVVIGGTSLFGGRGKVLWTVVGVAFITLIDNSLNILGLTYGAIMIAKGSIILLAALIDALRHRWAE